MTETIRSRAVVFPAARRVELRDIELPAPGPDDLLVRTLYSGVSAGTETWTLTGRFWSTKFPVVPGYQKVGVVERVGEAVTNYREGDTVYLRFSRIASDIHIEWAGHTEFSVVAAAEPEMFVLPAGLDPIHGSLLCLSAVGYHGAAEVMPVQPGEWVAVIGLGLIGQFSAQVARWRGARVIGIDLVPGRLDLAVKCAGVTPLRPPQQDVAAAIQKLCPAGLDAVIDTSAHADTVNASFHWLRTGGRYCFQGYYPDQTPIDFLQPHAKELTMYNPCNCTVVGQKTCADLLARGELKMQPLISHVVPVTDAPAIYDQLLNRRADTLGVVLDWTKS